MENQIYIISKNLKSVGKFVVIATTSTSKNLSVTRFGLTVNPVAIGVAFALPLGKKLIVEEIITKDIETKKVRKVNKLPFFW